MIELTTKEFEILKSIVIDGLTTHKEIAQRFNLKVTNIGYPIGCIFKKFGINSFSKLIWAYYTKKLPPFKKADENEIKRQRQKKITEFFEKLNPEQKIRFKKMREFGFSDREIITEIRKSPR